MGVGGELFFMCTTHGRLVPGVDCGAQGGWCLVNKGEKAGLFKREALEGLRMNCTVLGHYQFW